MNITLALGGGGAKGNAHIGIIRRLEKEGFKIKAIAGTSIGGIVAALYAAGYSPDEIEKMFDDINQTRLYGRSSNEKKSLLGLSGVRKWFDEVLTDHDFSDLKIPCAVSAVDLNSGKEIVLDSGVVKEALLATIALPGIFPSYTLGDWELVDGGVLNPVPVTLARSLQPKLPVVAVALNTPMGEPARSIGIPFSRGIPKPILNRLANARYAQAFDIFTRSVDVATRAITEYRLAIDKPNLIIRPKVTGVGLLEQVDVPELVQRGELAVEAVLPELKQIVSWKSRLRRRFMGGLNEP
ncbi:MAG: patatin-like phospholipase family protein [Anaerolineae bacterium]|nr:patatin-like phospholipase family protein [Anaerolineae bacterium]